MIDNTCVPFKRKPLYLTLTLPMIVVYIAMAVFLWQINVVFLAVYVVLFVSVALSMSYVCVHWQCPYVGRFAPCVGGFCLPSSQIARLHKHAKRSETRYKVFLTLAYTSFFGIVLFPMYFLYVKSILFLIGYVVIVVAYGVLFMLFICPVCGTRHICPGGQTAVKLREAINSRRSS
jgi:hypothetical protein